MRLINFPIKYLKLKFLPDDLIPHISNFFYKSNICDIIKKIDIQTKEYKLSVKKSLFIDLHYYQLKDNTNTFFYKSVFVKQDTIIYVQELQPHIKNPSLLLVFFLITYINKDKYLELTKKQISNLALDNKNSVMITFLNDNINEIDTIINTTHYSLQYITPFIFNLATTVNKKKLNELAKITAASIFINIIVENFSINYPDYINNITNIVSIFSYLALHAFINKEQGNTLLKFKESIQIALFSTAISLILDYINNIFKDKLKYFVEESSYLYNITETILDIVKDTLPFVISIKEINHPFVFLFYSLVNLTKDTQFYENYIIEETLSTTTITTLSISTNLIDPILKTTIEFLPESFIEFEKNFYINYFLPLLSSIIQLYIYFFYEPLNNLTALSSDIIKSYKNFCINYYSFIGSFIVDQQDKNIFIESIDDNNIYTNTIEDIARSYLISGIENNLNEIIDL